MSSSAVLVAAGEPLKAAPTMAQVRVWEPAVAVMRPPAVGAPTLQVVQPSTVFSRFSSDSAALAPVPAAAATMAEQLP